MSKNQQESEFEEEIDDLNGTADQKIRDLNMISSPFKCISNFS